MSSHNNKSDLLYKIYDPAFPLNSNTCSIVLGGSGSGKSYFTYNILLKVYLEKFDIQHLFIASRSASCDETLRDSFKEVEKEYPYLTIEFCEPSELSGKCQKARLDAMKAEYLEKLAKTRNYSQLKDVVESVNKTIDSVGKFDVIQEGMYLFLNDLYILLDESNYKVQEINKVGDDNNEDVDQSSEEVINSTPELIPENIDINYCINDSGLAINHNVFNEDNDRFRPEILIDYKGKETINEEDFNNQFHKGIFYFIRDKIIRPRLNSLKFGPSYQPSLAIVDDYAGTEELISPRSSLTNMVLLRRHLHLSIFILSQTATGLNTDIRRNANTFHLLPSLSAADIELISFRLPMSVTKKELQETYITANENKDRNQNLTSLFTVFPYHKIVTGAPKCLLKHYK